MPLRLSAVLALAAALLPALADAHALTTFDPPGGGKIIFGQVTGQSTEAGAIAAMLREVHQSAGDRPQVGRPFQARDSDAVMVFFTVVMRTQNDLPVAGLVIAMKTGPDHVEAALLSDEASRFGSKVNGMLRTLFEKWRPTGTAPPAGPMHTVTLRDNSASASIPDGWTVLPDSAGGTMDVQGPNGATALLGLPLDAMNSNDPRVRQTMAFARGAGRNTVYAKTLYYPYSGNPVETMLELVQMRRQMLGLPRANIQVASAEPMGRGARCVHVTGQSDPHDGMGTREFNAVFCLGPLSPTGTYMNNLCWVAVPIAVAERERATVGAMFASFTVNEAVVAREAYAMAAPVIIVIREIGRIATERAAAAEDLSNRQVQAVSNALLGKSVIADVENNEHFTDWNDAAQALTEADPDRFHLVPPSEYRPRVDF